MLASSRQLEQVTKLNWKNGRTRSVMRKYDDNRT
jgi:hypothetical protein